MSVAQRPTEASSDDGDGERPARLDVLVLGTFTTRGGIRQYIDEQRRRLPGSVSARVYDMYSPPPGEGLRWAVRTAVLTLWAALRFPFRKRPDVVHVHTSHRFSFYRASPYVLVAAWLWRRPVVLHVHGSSFDSFVADAGPLVGALQSVVFGASDRVVVLSSYWREELAGPVDPGKLFVLPNAVDPDEYDPTFGADPPRLVFVSSLIERKGVPALVEAVADLLDRVDDVRVDLAGAGPLEDDVAALAAGDEQVTYHGYVSEARKRELLSASSVYVLPTHAENLPIAMLEGMAGGNAVVATPVGGIPNVVDDEGGVLVPPGDAGALADALAALLEDPDRVEAMGRRNREVVAADHSWEAAAAELDGLYRELAGDASATA